MKNSSYYSAVWVFVRESFQLGVAKHLHFRHLVAVLPVRIMGTIHVFLHHTQVSFSHMY